MESGGVVEDVRPRFPPPAPYFRWSVASPSKEVDLQGEVYDIILALVMTPRFFRGI